MSHKRNIRDFPGGSVVDTSPSNVGGSGSNLGWGDKNLHTFRSKNQNGSNTVTNSNKDFLKRSTSKQSLKNVFNSHPGSRHRVPKILGIFMTISSNKAAICCVSEVTFGKAIGSLRMEPGCQGNKPHAQSLVTFSPCPTPPTLPASWGGEELEAESIPNGQ